MTLLILQIVFWICLAALLMPFVFYPLGVALLAAIRRRDHETDENHIPNVSLIISAFNESQIIGQKLANALALDYPRDRLEILVISDSSDDGTDEIVESFKDQGVVLCSQHPRKGKTRGLIEFVPSATGEVLLFSDANSMYEPAALRKLVRHFADPVVGYVVGHQRYITEDESAVAQSEGLYWKWEIYLKKCESRIASVVGGDGAIYAIRRELFGALRDDDINDFVNPLQIVVKGYRGVFDAEAVCYEETAATFQGEFRRKARIVNRSLRGVFRVPQALNPLRVGWSAFLLFFHKVLRWFMPCFLIGLLASNILLYWQPDAVLYPFYQLSLMGQLAMYGLAILRVVPGVGNLKPVYLAYYFCTVNLAAMLGIASAMFGQRYVVWKPERTEDTAPATGQ